MSGQPPFGGEPFDERSAAGELAGDGLGGLDGGGLNGDDLDDLGLVDTGLTGDDRDDRGQVDGGLAGDDLEDDGLEADGLEADGLEADELAGDGLGGGNPRGNREAPGRAEAVEAVERPEGGADPRAGRAAARAGLERVEKALAGRFPHRMLPDLSRMTDLVDLMGQPQRAYPSIHITGTNGKTSTARMIDALLRAFGIRTGRYTSPHLESVTERISLNGEPADPATFVAAYDEVLPYVELVDARHPERVTFHELLTAMAFAAFADAPVDVAVVEVGMGGSWDATNVIDGAVAVVTAISLDHRQYLGNTVAEIAGEKAGILRSDQIAVLEQQPVAAAEVLLERAAEIGTTVAREGFEFGVLERTQAVGGQVLRLRGLAGEYEEVFLPLYGEHQAHNAVCALAAVEAFLGGGGEQLDLETIREGFAAVDSPGRLEVVRRSPTVLLDGAHNLGGTEALVEALGEAFDFRRLIGVVAILADKDAAGMLAAVEPVLDAIVVTQSTSERGLPVDELAEIAVEVFGEDRVEVAPRLDDAVEAAITLAEEDDDAYGGVGVIVFGSLYAIGEARRLLHRP